MPAHRKQSEDLGAYSLAMWGLSEEFGAQKLKPQCTVFLNIPRYCTGTTPWGHPAEHHLFPPQLHGDGYRGVIGFTMMSLAGLQVGGLSEWLTQCRKVVLTTSKAIPVQVHVDGQPCNSQPHAFASPCTTRSPGCRRLSGGVPSRAEQYHVEQPLIHVSRVSMHDYEALHYKEPLRVLCVIGHCGDPRRQQRRALSTHTERLQQEPKCAEAKSPVCQKLSPKWCFLDATTTTSFYRMNQAQEHLNCVTEISLDEIYILDPELLGAFAGLTSNPHFRSPTSSCSPMPQSLPADATPPKGEELIEAAKRNDFRKLQELHPAGSDLRHRTVSTRSKEVIQYLLDHQSQRCLMLRRKTGRAVWTRRSPWASTPSATTSWRRGSRS